MWSFGALGRQQNVSRLSNHRKVEPHPARSIAEPKTVTVEVGSLAGGPKRLTVPKDTAAQHQAVPDFADQILHAPAPLQKRGLISGRPSQCRERHIATGNRSEWNGCIAPISIGHGTARQEIQPWTDRSARAPFERNLQFCFKARCLIEISRRRLHADDISAWIQGGIGLCKGALHVSNSDVPPGVRKPNGSSETQGRRRNREDSQPHVVSGEIIGDCLGEIRIDSANHTGNWGRIRKRTCQRLFGTASQQAPRSPDQQPAANACAHAEGVFVVRAGQFLREKRLGMRWKGAAGKIRFGNIL